MTSGQSSGAGPGTTPHIVGSHVELHDEETNRFLKQGMVAVEEMLVTQLNAGEEFITEKVRHLVEAGGKRFRPMFALLASQYGQRPGCDDVIKAATVVEMTHLATLYHDDVMDEAEKRRGVVSANARWDNSIAILAGDFLLARASCLMAELGVATVAHFADTFGTLVTGQMRETIGPDGSDPVDHYLAVIAEKTGVLIASAGYLGALHSGADEDTTESLRNLGAAVGMIFQIVDDIIDIYSDTKDSGKTPGTDLKEGVLTLPVLYAMQEDTDVGRSLSNLLTGPVTSEKELADVLELLRQSSGRAKCLEQVDHYREIAEKELASLPEIPATAALRKVVAFTTSRLG